MRDVYGDEVDHSERAQPATTIDPTVHILRGGRIFGMPSTPPLDLCFQAGKLSDIRLAGTGTGQAVDISGAWVMPGAIDSHIHPVHSETITSIGAVAPLAGVTTTLHHLYPNWEERPEQAALRAAVEASGASADYGFHVRITGDSVGRSLDPLSTTPGVVSVKVFLAHTDPRVTCTLGQLYSVMCDAASAGLPVIVHAEFGDVITEELRRHPPSTLADLDASRPSHLEAACVQTVCSLARLTRSTVYVAHVSSPAGIKVACQARSAGCSVLTETCPHYLLLDHGERLGGLGAVAPPLRDRTSVAGMRRAVRDGTVDVIASDHCGYGRADKRLNDVAGSSNGLPGVELLVPLLLDAAIEGQWLDPARMVEMLCTGPARAFRLAGKGKLEVGYDADMLVVDTSATTTVDSDRLRDQSWFSPYDGWSLRGAIRQVWRRGELLRDDNAVFAGGGGMAVQSARCRSTAPPLSDGHPLPSEAPA